MIYLDNNATTPIDPTVTEAMMPYILEHYGNPSSSHILGRTAKQAVEKARAQVASLLNATPDEIIFTSGGSESNNTVIKGVAWKYRAKGNHIITSATEHPSVLKVCEYLAQQGYRITYLPVDSYGQVQPADLDTAITSQTILVSVMHANNETGTIQPIQELAVISHRHGAFFHTDAAQSVGKIATDVRQLGVDFLTVAGHKLYAPKGIGALYIRQGVEIDPFIHGAGHERRMRAGTENVIFDVALGQACTVAQTKLLSSAVRDLTDYFWRQLQLSFGKAIVLNGHPTERLPNTLNVSFVGKRGYEILDQLSDVAASTGSACHAGQTSLSPVLKAMGIPEKIGLGAIRFSLGRFTSKADINAMMNQLVILIGKGEI
jgi:cysteine desulfurase